MTPKERPVFEVQVEGATYQVAAPDEVTAWKWANQIHESEKDKRRAEMAETRRMANPASGMSRGEQFAAGAGKAVSDFAHGGKQVVAETAAGVGDFLKTQGPMLALLNALYEKSGAKEKAEGWRDELRRESADRAKRDSPLMGTNAGMLGNIAGNAAMILLPGGAVSAAGKAVGAPALTAAGRSMMLPNSVTGNVAQGSLAGLSQPNETGTEKITNTGIGAASSFIIPAIAKAAYLSKTAIEPMYDAGRDRVIGRALNEITGVDDPSTIIARLKTARELVPGSKPTVAEVAMNPGLASFQRMATQSDSAAYGTRAIEQNAARLEALRGIAGEPADRAAAVALRESKAGPLYRSARKEGINPKVAEANAPLIENLVSRIPQRILDDAKVLAKVNGEVMGPEGSVTGLHWVKEALDNEIGRAGEQGLGPAMKSALLKLKEDLLSTLETLSPKYEKARSTYQKYSAPINQMEVGAEFLKRLETPLQAGSNQPTTLAANAFAKALQAGDETAKKATKFKGATLENTLTPAQLETLRAIKEDLERKVWAETAGKGVGSNTFQNLAYHNLANESGLTRLPGLLSRPVMVAEYITRALYGSANKQMQKRVAEAMLDPDVAAVLMAEAMKRTTLEQAGTATRKFAQPLGPAVGILSTH